MLVNQFIKGIWDSQVYKSCIVDLLETILINLMKSGFEFKGLIDFFGELVKIVGNKAGIAERVLGGVYGFDFNLRS